jgi:DUF971 family protein
MLRPRSIHLTEQRTLSVTWSDGVVCEYPLAHLRRNCPCAVCQEDRKSKGAFYIPLFTADGLTLERIVPNGHYAVQLYWKDGHHTGIYDFAYLRGLCPDAATAEEATGE